MYIISFQEAYIADLDAKSGASLKLTILNANGRIWTMVAGGGASVIYACVHVLYLLNELHRVCLKIYNKLILQVCATIQRLL